MGGDFLDHFISPRFGVSIHAPAWGATLDNLTLQDCRVVSIHAPAWGATIDGKLIHKAPLVSIHAPAWGATRQGRDPRPDNRVSIPAPAWGATQCQVDVAEMLRFQSTPPHGGDPERRQGSLRHSVSIHAPHGGRPVTGNVHRHRNSFNPRPRMGGDPSSRK